MTFDLTTMPTLGKTESGGEIKAPKEVRAQFLSSSQSGSIDEAGYEFINADTEKDRAEIWKAIKHRIEERVTRAAGAAFDDATNDGQRKGDAIAREQFRNILKSKRQELGYINTVAQCLDELILEIG